MFIPYPSKTNGMSHQEHKDACSRISSARLHLKYLCEKTMNKTGLKILDCAMQEIATARLTEEIVSINEEPLEKFILAFINRTKDPDLIQAMAQFLLLLVGDAAMSLVLPHRYHKHILDTCSSIRKKEPFQTRLQEMKEYGVELSNLLHKSTVYTFEENCTTFVEYLVHKIEEIHQKDKRVPPITVMEESYNPEKGTCYYFTQHGNQIRKQPKYNINPSNKNYDNTPTVDDICRKKFPSVSYGGFGYIFLWFCPIHGHCYGFHLIQGGEGRKDPFSSLFKYLPCAPEEIFYDFACGLSEYILNREPQYFLETRFWHDLFHSFTHTCGKCFKSSRICELAGVNSEICEQFNSYLQCIKYTGSHLSQSHFMFFVQFFIYLWNCEKTTKYQNIINVAIAGTQ